MNLNLSNADTNKKVTQAVIQHVKQYSVDEVVQALSTDFVNHEIATKSIYAALVTGKNAMLYGPGGYGKSELVKAICKLLDIPVIYKVCYKGMTTEELLGIPNMDKLLKESTFETSFENSLFSKPGILILEELFDADPSVMAALKDIMTEKGFREKDTKKESLISNIIVTGNKDPEEVATNDSLKAFFQERFAYKHRMIWKDFSFNSYKNFYKVFYKTTFENNYELFLILSKLCSNNPQALSPRKAIDIADTALSLGLDHLNIIDELDISLIDNVKREIKFQVDKRKEEEKIKDIKEYIESVLNTTEVAEQKLFLIEHTLEQIENNREFINSEFFELYDTLLQYIKSQKQELKEVVSIKLKDKIYCKDIS